MCRDLGGKLGKALLSGVLIHGSVGQQSKQAPYHNQGLFSNYFLEQRLEKLPGWEHSAMHADALADLRALYAKEKEFLNMDLKESQVEERFFRPVFRRLGFAFEVQEDADKSPNEPDYALFAGRMNLDEARRNKGTVDFYSKALAVGEVKSWNCELDRLGQDRYNKRRNPSFQIWLYLKETKQKWGILTNGRKWRLYHHDRAMDIFYEVDLVSLLEGNNPEDFRYFLLFFGSQAFCPGPDGSVFIDQVFRGSEDYAREVGENLKENVYRALRVLAQGFVDRPENFLDPTDSDELLEVQKNSMRLLYRLLFIFYAEGKGLLSDSTYFESDYSLHRLKHEIADKIDEGRLLLPTGKSYWMRLRNLFELIDAGSEAAGITRNSFHVPPYNGGLFDRTRNRFLEDKVIGDLALAEAIDLLARASSDDGIRGFVDYSTLGVRHLGSIYEGLLEYRIRVANEQMVATGDKLLWMPYSKYKLKSKRPLDFREFPKENRAETSELFLETHKGERKSSGSYYTPEFVVEYIVDNALTPILDKKWNQARQDRTSVVSATLSTKILDPAMGSGHFLVEVIEYLAPKLLEAVELDIESGHLTEEQAAQFTSDWAKREIASHCVYGVDLNDLAVELSKVSIWLSTVSKERPLSFLDHRLKRGNSLFGSKIVDLPWLPGVRPAGVVGQLDKPYGFVEKMLVQLQELDAIPDESVDDVKRKESLFAKLKDSSDYRRIRAVADVHTGIYFIRPDLESIRKGYNDLINDAYHADSRRWHERFELSWARQASAQSEAYCAFHWELEFPEIFFEGARPRENSGFDVVVGNPPYDVISSKEQDRPEDEVETEKAYYSAQPNLVAATSGKMNYYRLFLLKSINLLRIHGTCGFIVPMGFLGDEQSYDTRKHMMTHAQITRVEVFPHKDKPEKRVFKEAKLSTCICILRRVKKGDTRDSFRLRVHPFGWIDDTVPTAIIDYEDISKLSPQLLSFPVRPFISKAEIKLATKIGSISGKLARYGTSNQGEVNVTSDKSMIVKLKQRSRLPDNYSETVRGAYVNRYLLLPEPKQGEYYFLDTGRFPPNSSSASGSKSDAHRYPRVGYQRGSAIDNWRRIIATLIPAGRYCCDTVNYISRPSEVSLEFILAFLNSSFAEWRFRITSSTNHVNSYEIDNLPIPDIAPHISGDASRFGHDDIQLLNSLDVKTIIGHLKGMPGKSRTIHDYLRYLAGRMLEETMVAFLLGRLTEGKLLAGSQEKITAISYLARVEPSLVDNEAVINEAARKHIPIVCDRISKMDNLIDRLVFELFGLNEDEINIIVESFQSRAENNTDSRPDSDDQ